LCIARGTISGSIGSGARSNANGVLENLSRISTLAKIEEEVFVVLGLFIVRVTADSGVTINWCHKKLSIRASVAINGEAHHT
jgi:hypothetical protein